jgi:hypothetical protein
MSFFCQLFDKIGIIASRSYSGMRCSCFFLLLVFPLRNTTLLFITPAFGYGAPHLGTRGTLTLVDNVLLSARFVYSAIVIIGWKRSP